MDKKTLFKVKTNYGTFRVVDDKQNRLLMCNQHIESAINLDKKDDLLFPYMQRFSYAFVLNPKIKKVLLLGGGAFAYPRYFLNQYPNKEIDVVEISKEVLDINQKYFFLDDVKNERMNIICDDGFHFLQRSSQKYDFIINDAFIGNQLMGKDATNIHRIHEHLNQNGIYMINVTSAIRGLSSRTYHQMYKLLQKEFATVEMMQCDEDRKLEEKQNILLIATDIRLQ